MSYPNLVLSPNATEEEKIIFYCKKQFLDFKEDTKRDLVMRISGVPATRGATGYQFAGYKTLEQFYRGDQWSSDPAPGASQRTDNYCAVIVDNLSSLIFDDSPEINCPTDDPTDEMLEIKAELKEKFLWKVWQDNDFEITFDDWSKSASAYGDGFLKGPYMEKRDKAGELMDPNSEGGTWHIVFSNIENPASIRPVFSGGAYKKMIGFIHSDRISVAKAESLYGAAARAKGIKIEASITGSDELSMFMGVTNQPMVNIEEKWISKEMAVFINDQLLYRFEHNWGFVPLRYVRNNKVPNYPYGKSDIEDVLDPQMSHNTTNNDLANLLKWIASVNLWGKNIEGMQALVAGISRIYSLPEDGELHAFEKTGDPYVTNTYVQQRRSAIVEISGVSESMLSSSQLAASSGRALALAFQGTIRKLNPRAKRFKTELKHLNENILKLAEIYFPKTKQFIEGDYRNEVFLPTTLLRNIVDTINKFQSGLISQDTAMREAGVAQPNLEKRMMKKDLADPILGPQVARQPQLLPRLNEGENQPGDNPMAAPGHQPSAGQEGAVNGRNQRDSGAAPTPK